MNEEFLSYLELFKEVNFEQKLADLSHKYKDKRVILYGAGIFFDALVSAFKLDDYLNIIGVSDMKFNNSEEDEYKGFRTYLPQNIRHSGVDVVLNTTRDFSAVKKFLKSNNLVRKNVEINNFIQKSAIEKRLELQEKFKHLKELLHLQKNPINILKYCLFCNATELKSKVNYQKVLKRIKSDRTNPIRVMFIVEENEKWGWQSVYDVMSMDSNFKILPIIALPARLETQEKTIEFFKQLGINAIDGFDQDSQKAIYLQAFKPDIVFYQQPIFLRQTYTPEVLSEQALCCITSYGYSSLSAENWGTEIIKMKLANMWKMFIESPYHTRYFEKTANLKGKDVLKVSGYPKLDYYNEPVDEQFEKLWKDENNITRFRIIYAPHHSIENFRLGMSNFKSQYKFFLQFAQENPQYSFVFKPHPFLKEKCISEKFMTAEQFESYIEAWNSLENASVYDKGNYFDLFKTSDVLITDCSSFLGEYFASGKPIVFLDKATRAGFNKFGEKMKKLFYIPNSVDELPQLLRTLSSSKGDYLKEKRLKLIRSEYYIPKRGIGFELVSYIKKELGRDNL